MATSSHNRAFQAYNNHNYKNSSSITKPSISTIGEPITFGHIPYSSIKTTVETISSSPSSLSPAPHSILKPILMTSKQRPSINSLGHFLPRQKSLQMTRLASQRQSLWMSIAKNDQVNNTQPSPIPLRHEQTNLIRKKLLRLLLVFSYLLSISLFAIALTTFYGFFWSGYDITQTAVTTPTSNIGTTILSIVSLTSNSTLIDIDFSLEDDLVLKT